MSLVVDGLTKRFGPVVALDGVTWTAAPGQVFGFLGANGAGKTTAMRVVLGILRPDAGRVTWQGRDTHALPRRTWGYLPEERGLYPRMRVADQLAYFASLHGLAPPDARRRAGEWLERFRITELGDRHADELSKGNQQKVQFIAAVLHEPAVLLMDEPFTGLDPVNVGLLRDAFLELRDAGRTIVFSTHQMEAAEALCDAIAIIDRGRVVLGGALSDVRRATGSSRVRIAVAGERDLGSLARREGAVVVRRGVDGAELTVPAGDDPAALLAEALASGLRVTAFELVEPTLEELFVRSVGAARDDETDEAGTESDGRRRSVRAAGADDPVEGLA
ncbi:MAG TPA: ATP-binding cassette domain-containing protein [Candidatus Limnocylindrales bacterium]|nr:ATP-binding cassette domain-containing protein [Candidatus Limnocylindrales bacterium]